MSDERNSLIEDAQWPVVGDAVPRRGGRLSTAFSRGVLRLFGWRVEGTFPNCPRLIMIAAPHSSNWDWVLAMLTMASLRLRMHWLGKHTLFEGAKGGFFRWFGGIPVDRTAPGGVVEQVSSTIRAASQFVLAIAPEGTRSRVAGFKTGFYHIARAAQVPILPVLVDYPGRRLVLLDAVEPSDDAEADMAAIEALFPHLNVRTAGSA